MKPRRNVHTTQRDANVGKWSDIGIFLKSIRIQFKVQFKKIIAMAIKICIEYFLFNPRTATNESFSFTIIYWNTLDIKNNQVVYVKSLKPLTAHLAAGFAPTPAQLWQIRLYLSMKIHEWISVQRVAISKMRNQLSNEKVGKFLFVFNPWIKNKD